MLSISQNHGLVKRWYSSGFPMSLECYARGNYFTVYSHPETIVAGEVRQNEGPTVPATIFAPARRVAQLVATS